MKAVVLVCIVLHLLIVLSRMPVKPMLMVSVQLFIVDTPTHHQLAIARFKTAVATSFIVIIRHQA